MTLAVVNPTTLQPNHPQTVPIVVLGTDALLAASPSTPVQLAHACLRAGYANVIPASWGDELIAAAVLRRLPEFANGPAIQCSCPIVAHRLLTVGGDLRAALLALVPPPVAIARYVRALSQPTPTRITYVGRCPGAIDDSIDIRMTPASLLAMLAERNIALDEQPRVFESVIPPDRRRFRSQPGGLPSAEALWNEVGARTLVEIDGEDLVTDLAQQLLGGKNVLIDVSARLGCACSGAVAGTSPKNARASVVALEPPRSTTPVVEEDTPIDLDLTVPAAPRTPTDVLAVPPHDAPPRPVLAPPAGTMPLGHRISPVRGLTSVGDPRQSRAASPVNPRPVLGALPVARDVEGKSLPRAYVARRRSSPKGIPVMSLPPDDIAEPRVSIPLAHRPSAAATPTPAAPAALPLTPSPAVSAPAATPAPVASPTAPMPGDARAESEIRLALPTSLAPRHLVYIVGAILLLTLSISTVVAVVVGRSLRQAPPATSTR
jgi:hypothetical protein